MPKARSTCTRCSMRRQKCDRKTPCGRCVANQEPHLCTTEWTNGYNPNIHRKYPRKASSSTGPSTNPPHDQEIAQSNWPDGQHWSNTPDSGQDVPTRSRQQDTSSFRNNPFSPTPTLDHAQSQEPRPSSHNLDFVTYGRSEFTDVSIGALLSSKEADPRDKASLDQALSEGACNPFAGANASNYVFSPAARAVEVYHLRSLLPAKEPMFHMVTYHENHMVYWSGGIYHGPTFRKELISAYGESNDLDIQRLDWRWTALLFAILSSAIIGSTEATSNSWGYAGSEKTRLAKQWASACIACLQLGDYASKYHIHSIQAILNLHTSEHLVGASKEWVVYQTGAIAIARGLGLHRIGPHPDDGKCDQLSPERKEALVQREISRRIWMCLVSQDWLCSTSQGLYNIQRRHFTTIKPSHFDEETMTPITDDRPAFTHISNYLNEVSFLLVCYHDDVLDAPDLATKYNVVIKYDAKMRAIASEKMPNWVKAHVPYNHAWPKWAKWAKSIHNTSWAHKIIMMHQAFLGRSFKSPQYTYSRWACCNAAKIIIEGLAHDREPEEPQWWVEHAILVTAGICLALDLFHRTEEETEAREHLTWIEKAIKTLEQWSTSSVANHGRRLLTSLLQEYHKKMDPTKSLNAGAPATMPAFPENMAPQSLVSDAVDSEQMQQQQQQQEMNSETLGPPEIWPLPGIVDFDLDGFGGLMETLPIEVGLDTVFMETMLSTGATQPY